MDRRLKNLMIFVAMTALTAGGSSAKQPRVAYPRELIGVWQGDANTCTLPGNLDSDTRMEIGPHKLIDYEQWNEPIVVLQISKDPKAWKIKSRLHIDGYSVDQYEVYILSDSNLGTLTVVDRSRPAIYARCM